MIGSPFCPRRWDSKHRTLERPFRPLSTEFLCKGTTSITSPHPSGKQKGKLRRVKAVSRRGGGTTFENSIFADSAGFFFSPSSFERKKQNETHVSRHAIDRREELFFDLRRCPRCVSFLLEREGNVFARSGVERRRNGRRRLRHGRSLSFLLAISLSLSSLFSLLYHRASRSTPPLLRCAPAPRVRRRPGGRERTLCERRQGEERRKKKKKEEEREKRERLKSSFKGK